jgi:S1-C subfamily serine protease
VPVNIAKRIVPELVRSGEVSRPKLGIGTRNVEAFKNQLDLPISEGVIILQVAPGEAAANAGLRGVTQTENGDFEIGDIIVGIDGEKVNNTDDLYHVLDKHQIGDAVQMQIFRNGRRTNVPVRLTAPAANRGILRR